MGAGLCSSLLDAVKFMETQDQSLKAIYGLRALNGFVSSGFTITAAFSYCGPLLQHTADGMVRHGAGHRLTILAARTAAGLAERVGLLVWAARLNMVGLALIAVEIGYLSIRDNELQNWCEQCAFRKYKSSTNWMGRRSPEKYFGNIVEELKALERSKQVVGV